MYVYIYIYIYIIYIIYIYIYICRIFFINPFFLFYNKDCYKIRSYGQSVIIIVGN